MVEINTVFEQLVSVLSKIEPAKLNETLGALASGLNGRGKRFGQTHSKMRANGMTAASPRVMSDWNEMREMLTTGIDVMAHLLNSAPCAAPCAADRGP